MFSSQRRASASSSSTAASPVRTKTLSEQHHQLTEQLIRLKFEIAEQKGKHGELQFDWKKLNSEKHSLHTDLIDNEKECASIRDEIHRIREEQTQARLRIDQIVAGNAPERTAVAEVKAEHDTIQAELLTTKEEFQKVKASGEELHRTIEDLKERAAEISSERVKISSNSERVMTDIERLKKEIVAMRSSVQHTGEKSEQYEKDLVVARKESEQLAKQNDALESKISAREDYLAKRK